MSLVPVRVKQPDEIVTVPFDFGPKLAKGATIVGSATAFAAAGLTVLGSSVVAPIVNVQVSGGALGTTYRLTCRVNVSNGDLRELDCDVRVAEEN